MEKDFYTIWLSALAIRIAEKGLSAAELAEQLCLSESAFYKRKSGRMEFGAREMLFLSKLLDVPLSESELSGQYLPFEVVNLPGQSFDADLYIAGLGSVVEHYAKPEWNQSARVRISTTDIPIFWLLAEPALAAFKLFAFETENVERIEENFSLSHQLDRRADWITRAKQVAEGYFSVASEEVWGATPFRGILYQILYLAEARAMSIEDAKIIFESLTRLVGEIKNSSQKCEKVGGSSFSLSQNQFHSTASIISVKSPEREEVFVTFDNPNFVRSSSPSTCAYFDAYFERVQRSATRVNGRGVYSGRRFEQEILARIERTKDKVLRRLSVADGI